MKTQVEINRILPATIASTSMMTVFSYAVSRITGRQFREPEILSRLIRRLQHKDFTRTTIDGWMLHYIAGLLFVLAYDQIWRKTKMRSSVKSGAVLGLVSGFLGAEIWRKVYQFHPHPPQNNFKAYYAQLIPAHVIFGIFASLGYEFGRNKV